MANSSKEPKPKKNETDAEMAEVRAELKAEFSVENVEKLITKQTSELKRRIESLEITLKSDPDPKKVQEFLKFVAGVRQDIGEYANKILDSAEDIEEIKQDLSESGSDVNTLKKNFSEAYQALLDGMTKLISIVKSALPKVDKWAAEASKKSDTKKAKAKKKTTAKKEVDPATLADTSVELENFNDSLIDEFTHDEVEEFIAKHVSSLEKQIRKLKKKIGLVPNKSKAAKLTADIENTESNIDTYEKEVLQFSDWAIQLRENLKKPGLDIDKLQAELSKVLTELNKSMSSLIGSVKIASPEMNKWEAYLEKNVTKKEGAKEELQFSDKLKNVWVPIGDHEYYFDTQNRLRRKKITAENVPGVWTSIPKLESDIQSLQNAFDKMEAITDPPEDVLKEIDDLKELIKEAQDELVLVKDLITGKLKAGDKKEKEPKLGDLGEVADKWHEVGMREYWIDENGKLTRRAVGSKDDGSPILLSSLKAQTLMYERMVKELEAVEDKTPHQEQKLAVLKSDLEYHIQELEQVQRLLAGERPLDFDGPSKEKTAEPASAVDKAAAAQGTEKAKQETSDKDRARLTDLREKYARADAAMNKKYRSISGWLRRFVPGGGYNNAKKELQKSFSEYKTARAEVVLGRLNTMLEEQTAVADARAREIGKIKSIWTKAYDGYKKLGKLRIVIPLAVTGGSFLVGGAAAAGAAYAVSRAMRGLGSAVGSYDLMKMGAGAMAPSVNLSQEQKAELSEYVKSNKVGKWARFRNSQVLIDGKLVNAKEAYQLKISELSAQNAPEMSDEKLGEYITYVESVNVLNGKQPSTDPTYMVLMKERAKRYEAAIDQLENETPGVSDRKVEDKDVIQALFVLGLDSSVSIEDLAARRDELLEKYSEGGSEPNETTEKAVTNAYEIVVAHMTSEMKDTVDAVTAERETAERKANLALAFLTKAADKQDKEIEAKVVDARKNEATMKALAAGLGLLASGVVVDYLTGEETPATTETKKIVPIADDTGVDTGIPPESTGEIMKLEGDTIYGEGSQAATTTIRRGEGILHGAKRLIRENSEMFEGKTPRELRNWRMQELKDMGFKWKGGKWGYPNTVHPGAELSVYQGADGEMHLGLGKDKVSLHPDNMKWKQGYTRAFYDAVDAKPDVTPDLSVEEWKAAQPEIVQELTSNADILNSNADRITEMKDVLAQQSSPRDVVTAKPPIMTANPGPAEAAAFQGAQERFAEAQKDTIAELQAQGKSSMDFPKGAWSGESHSVTLPDGSKMDVGSVDSAKQALGKMGVSKDGLNTFVKSHAELTSADSKGFRSVKTIFDQPVALPYSEKANWWVEAAKEMSK